MYIIKFWLIRVDIAFLESDWQEFSAAYFLPMSRLCVFTIMVDFRFAAVSFLTSWVRILLCSFLVSVLTRFGFTPAESSWRRPSAAASSGTPNPGPAKKQWQSYIPGFEEGHGFKSLPDTRLRCSSVEIFPAWKWYQEIKLHPTSHYLVVIESRN